MTNASMKKRPNSPSNTVTDDRSSWRPDGAIGQMAQQEPPAARRDLAADHLGLDLRLVARPQLVKGRDAGAILIAQRQVQQHVFDGGDAQAAQPIRQSRPDALQGGNRERFGGQRPRQVSRFQSRVLSSKTGWMTGNVPQAADKLWLSGALYQGS